MAPQSGRGNFLALSKVSEEASSLEKSSGDVSSANKVKGPGPVTDRDGRQSTSSVLGNIHEQVCESSHPAHSPEQLHKLHASPSQTPGTSWRGRPQEAASSTSGCAPSCGGINLMPLLRARCAHEGLRVTGVGASGPEAQQRDVRGGAGRVSAVAGARPPGGARRRQRPRHPPPLPAASGERRAADIGSWPVSAASCRARHSPEPGDFLHPGCSVADIQHTLPASIMALQLGLQPDSRAC